MNAKFAAVKKFVSDHKVAIAVVSTAVIVTAVGIAADRGRVAQWNNFLDEHNLTDAFYAIED